MDSGAIRDSVMLVLMFIVFGVPALAIPTRIALKPVIEALVRLRDISAARGAVDSDQRVAALESEVGRLQAEVQRLSESEAFTRQLIQGGNPKR
jgi:hypothetical protein